jgi:hypothetical protein
LRAEIVVEPRKRRDYRRFSVTFEPGTVFVHIRGLTLCTNVSRRTVLKLWKLPTCLPKVSPLSFLKDSISPTLQSWVTLRRRRSYIWALVLDRILCFWRSYVQELFVYVSALYCDTQQVGEFSFVAHSLVSVDKRVAGVAVELPAVRPVWVSLGSILCREAASLLVTRSFSQSLLDCLKIWADRWRDVSLHNSPSALYAV